MPLTRNTRTVPHLVVSAREGCVPRVACMPGGMRASGACVACTPPPLWTEFLTHACENITFPQLLLRAVMNNYTGHLHNEFVNTFIRVAKHFIYATKCQSKKLNFTYVEICARQEVDRCHT